MNNRSSFPASLPAALEMIAPVAATLPQPSPLT